MKLVMTLLVRDEEDILAANIEYHLSRGVDHIIATDNLSTDATPDILAHYRSQGVLEWVRETSDTFEQPRWVTRMAEIATHEHRADWVINNDADEFWWPDGAESLKDVLGSIDDDCIAVRAERTNFRPWREPRPGPFFESIVVRDRISTNALGRPLPPKTCHRGVTGVVSEPGNHHVSIGGTPLPRCESPISILHFPLRTYEQFESKIVSKGSASERHPTLATPGGTTRHLYEVYRAGGLRDVYAEESLTERKADELVGSGECVIDTRLRDYLRERGGVDGRGG